MGNKTSSVHVYEPKIRMAYAYPNEIQTMKICLLGAEAQGKSALVYQFITGQFLADYDPTIEEIYQKTIWFHDQTALIEILDTAGQEVYWSMQSQWILESEIFLLVFSITSLDGFKTTDELRKQIFKQKPKDTLIILVGTCADLSVERVVSRDQAQQKARQYKCKYVEVSSFTGDNVNELFEMVVSHGMGQHGQSAPSLNNATAANSSNKAPYNSPSIPKSAPSDTNPEESHKNEVPRKSSLGSHTNPKEWDKTEVMSWLCSVENGKYARYKDMFIANEFDGEDLELVDKVVLKDYGVVKLSHQVGIMSAIKQLFHAHDTSDEDDTKEEMKAQSDVCIALYKYGKSVDNVFVMFFGIGKYQSKTYPDLDDIIEDESYFSDVFEKQFKYRFIANCEYNRTWSKSQAEDWIELVRDSELLHNREVQYDALIFCGASHGSIDAMICSDGQELKLKDIRSSFVSNRQIRDLPKIFIFNCCRTPYQKPSGARGDTRAAGHSVTITSTEGDPVFGSRLSRYVAGAFGACCANRMDLHSTLRLAAQNAKNGKMELRLQEHDIEIDDIVFLKNPTRRGAEIDDPFNTGDDDLINLLRPQKDGSKMDLCYKQYYSALLSAGFKGNGKLRTLTKE
eukprot:755507_1